MGFHWLKMEAAAEAALASGELGDHPAEFYHAKIQTAQFYLDHILPKTKSLRTTMFTPVDSMMGMHKNDFSFDHAL